MSEKLTLAHYLRGGGEVKTLTRIEAMVFGIPYPLQPGWPRKYGALVITPDMLEDLRARISVAKESTARSAHRRLDGLRDVASAARPMQTSLLLDGRASPVSRVSPVPGFVLRQARRYRSRRSAPWA